MTRRGQPFQRKALPGYSRADLHVHTAASDGTMLSASVVKAYAELSECCVIAITDHDRIDGALHARAFAERESEAVNGIQIIVGQEVSAKEGHIVGLFLKKKISPKMSAARTIDAIHAQAGLAVAAHPYTWWGSWRGSNGVGDLIQSLPFDAVEVRNSNFTEVFANRKAARRVGDKARLGSSDSHFVGAIGRCLTEFPGKGAEDLRRAILERTTIAMGSCYGIPTLLAHIFERIRAKKPIYHGWPHKSRMLEARMRRLNAHMRPRLTERSETPSG